MPVSAAFPAKVIGITDGDTIKVLDASNTQHRVRLAGIDAPERKQAWGTRSRQGLAEILAGKDVTIEDRKTDRWGRIIGVVWITPPDCPTCPRTLDAGMSQLTRGLAWHFKRYAHEQPPEERGQYAFAEEEARAKGVGLWSDGDPVPPWEWRKKD
jgi:endonuclease YncB( thermonuclease family)